MKSLAAMLVCASALLFSATAEAWEIGKTYSVSGYACQQRGDADSLPKTHKERGFEAAGELYLKLSKERNERGVLCTQVSVTIELVEHVSTYTDLEFPGRDVTIHVFKVLYNRPVTGPNTLREFYVIVLDGFDQQ